MCVCICVCVAGGGQDYIGRANIHLINPHMLAIACAGSPDRLE